MHLALNAPDSDYYAFCDQDDFWLPNKLSCAIEILEKIFIQMNYNFIFRIWSCGKMKEKVVMSIHQI